MSTLINIVKRRNIAVSQFIAISFLFSFILFFSQSHVMAQTPDWSWATSAGATSSDRSTGICTDNNGNTYATGYFGQSITFGNTTLTDAGGSDIYLVKYNNQGGVVWAKSFGGSGLDYTNKIRCDATGNLFLTGAFRSSSIDFDSFSLTNPNSGNGYDAFFVVKISPDGNVQWASTNTSDGNCWGNDLDTDSDGNIIITGSFDGVSATFGTTTLTNTYQFFADIFLVKYNSSGDVLWAQSFGGNSYDYGTGVAFGANGHINLIGRFESNEIAFGVSSFINSGGSDFFIVNFSAEGLIDWLRNAQGDGDDGGNAIETDSFGNIYVTGIYAGSSISFGLNILPGNGFDNIFIIKYEHNGGIAWVQYVNGEENDESYALTVDNDGSLLVTGEFESEQLTFDGPVTVSNSSPGYSDLFVVKLNPSGIVKWATSAGGNDSDYGGGISTNSAGNAFIAGDFYSTSILFGTTTLVNASNTNNSTDCFIAKLNSTTGIDEASLSGREIIYPNPATNWFTIQSLATNIGDTKVELYDLNGKRLLNKYIPKGTENNYIDASSLESGVYFVQIQSGDKTVTKKLVIQK